MGVQPKKSSRLFIILGVVLTLLSMVGVYFVSRSATQSAQNGAVPVLVAAREIPQHTTFNSSSDATTWLKSVTLPSGAKPVGSFSSISQFTQQMLSGGKAATMQSIAANEPVVSTMFNNIGSRSGVTTAFQLKKGDVAISLQVSAVNDSAEAVQPGDAIDLIASYLPSGGGGGTTESPTLKHAPGQTQYMLQDLKVMALGQITPTNPTGTGSQGASGDATMITLEVNHQTALVIQHLKDFSGSWDLSIVLRSAYSNSQYTTNRVESSWFTQKLRQNFQG